MEVANGEAEALLSLLGKRTRLLQLLWIEVDVRVEIHDVGHAPDVVNGVARHKQAGGEAAVECPHSTHCGHPEVRGPRRDRDALAPCAALHPWSRMDKFEYVVALAAVITGLD